MPPSTTKTATAKFTMRLHHSLANSPQNPPKPTAAWRRANLAAELPISFSRRETHYSQDIREVHGDGDVAALMRDGKVIERSDSDGMGGRNGRNGHGDGVVRLREGPWGLGTLRGQQLFPICQAWFRLGTAGSLSVADDDDDAGDAGLRQWCRVQHQSLESDCHMCFKRIGSNICLATIPSYHLWE